MTIINGIEIDDIEYLPNEGKAAIRSNAPLQARLPVLLVISNPCQYARRYILAREFIQRMERDEPLVDLYIVELVYGKKHSFHISQSNHPRHLRLRTDAPPLWHKENMINLGVRHLLPADWRCFAWIDADVEFESTSWAEDTLRILNGTLDVVQLFGHTVDMDRDKSALNIFSGFGYQFAHGRRYAPLQKTGAINYWHPGFAWAITRTAYNQLGGLFQLNIIGGGDHIMALSLLGKGQHSMNEAMSDGYKSCVAEFQARAHGLRLGYVPGTIRHHFHGKKVNRRYNDRWRILADTGFDPSLHLTLNDQGLIVPSPSCPPDLPSRILDYLFQRNEDDDDDS